MTELREKSFLRKYGHTQSFVHRPSDLSNKPLVAGDAEGRQHWRETRAEGECGSAQARQNEASENGRFLFTLNSLHPIPPAIFHALNDTPINSTGSRTNI